MHNIDAYIFLRKQIPLMLGLSLLPGIGYIFLGWINDVATPALMWYAITVIVSFWGWRLYRPYNLEQMGSSAIKRWYTQVSLFFIAVFALWTLIFLLYSGEERGHMNYIAIFTQIGAAVVASTLLASDRRLFTITLSFLLLPLAIYFLLIGELYGYILALFSLVLMGVLFYASFSSYTLLKKHSYEAIHDHLTGLYNRRHFIDYLERRVSNLQKHEEYAFIMLIDLDHFKSINDSLGHDIGDKLLKIVSNRLQEQLLEEQMLARLGGDEFVIVSQNYSSRVEAISDATHYSNQLLSRLKETFIIDQHHLYISASIGIEVIQEHTTNAHRLIKEADIAMYEVKAQGRDGVIIFNDELSKRIESHLQIERHLHVALKNREISLVYQPQVNNKEQVIGCEVLVRWNNKKLGVVGPDKFIPVAEQTGLILEIGSFILEESFKTLAAWSKQGISLQQFSINISVRQLFHNSFITDVEQLAAHYLSTELTSKLIFEITETVMVQDIERVVQIMKKLSHLKIEFSMDDFGTGYSSLSYLRTMPIAELKIDQSFIANLEDEASDQAMIKTILNMANIFELHVVAEGVETEAQRDFLRNNGCHIFQGYYFSKPLIQEDFLTYYRAQIALR